MFLFSLWNNVKCFCFLRINIRGCWWFGDFFVDFDGYVLGVIVVGIGYEVL